MVYAAYADFARCGMGTDDAKYHRLHLHLVIDEVWLLGITGITRSTAPDKESNHAEITCCIVHRTHTCAAYRLQQLWSSLFALVQSGRFVRNVCRHEPLSSWPAGTLRFASVVGSLWRRIVAWSCDDPSRATAVELFWYFASSSTGMQAATEPLPARGVCSAASESTWPVCPLAAELV
jgi:hypothetical protein